MKPLSRAQAAARLNVTPARVSQFVTEGRLTPVEHIGQMPFFAIRDLDRLKTRKGGWPKGKKRSA